MDDALLAAYRVIRGKLSVVIQEPANLILGFTAGMWVGVKAVLYLGQQRRTTVYSAVFGGLRAVPSDGF